MGNHTEEADSERIGKIRGAEVRQENEKFYRREFHEHLLKRTEAGLHLFQVCEHQAEIIGLMDFDFNGDETWLMRFYIRPELIGQGVGKSLMKHCEHQLWGLNRNHYRLLVHEKNLLGIRFYERNGFTRKATGDDVSEHEICYEKTILPHAF